MNEYFVDRDARDVLAELLRHLATGQITNDDFEYRTPRSRDHAVRAAKLAAWGLYDDMKEHRLTGEYKLSSEAREGVARLILFLKTDQPWPGSPPSARPVLVGVAAAFALCILAPHVLWAVLMFLVMLGLYAVGYVRRWLWNRDPDRTFWPFGSIEAYERAIENPPYLRGKAG
jgi:hypothetical protein